MIFDPLELNYSKIRCFRFCPLLFKTTYIDRHRQPLTPQSSLGVSIHRALERFHRKNNGDLNDLMFAYDEGWVGSGYGSAQEQMTFYNKGRKILLKYWEAQQENKSRVVAVEKDFAFTYGKWTIKGTIDRIDELPDGTWEVIDYKSGTEEITQQEAEESLQLGIYALGASRGLDIKPAFVTFWLLAYEKKLTVPYNPERDETVLKAFDTTGEDILKGEFPPDTKNCALCSIRHTCPSSVSKEDENV